MSDQTLGDQPIEAQYLEQMKTVASVLNEVFNGETRGPARKTGFVLLVFPFNDHGGRCNFISNGAQREDIVCLFREMIARLEGMPDQEGHG